ncbi:MAG: hypothetical protein JNK04_17630, partial [Myxococcales bacterium]|nr:hypothetical protein [Myxococcales bacterium]
MALLLGALASGVLASLLPGYAVQICFANGILGVVVLLTMPQPGGSGLGAVIDALRDARRGKRVTPPEGATGEISATFEEIGRIVDETEDLAEQKEAAEREAAKLKKDIDEQIGRLKSEVERANEEVKKAKESGPKTALLREPTSQLADSVGEIESAHPIIAQVVTDLAGNVRTVNQTLVEVYQSIESLATSAEESSSSILEMTTTNEEVAQNVAELAASVRETATSIEEMAYSIREVARNIDALSLTAEETSSSMNEMDVSIDQVQSNANETARLSEEVALDAERGAEAILKTIGEINRIRESSQEAVSVISNLGTRIDAIGQILAVIDDVAE